MPLIKNRVRVVVQVINPVYLLLVLFFLFKLNHVHLPYFWDELGVYSRAALYMFDHQISMMPNSIPPELSRGHPLLCAVVFAVGYRLLGSHVWAGHLTALLWSCGLLYLLYRLARDLFGHRTALLASALLAVQPIFLAQSSMVLPEVMLAFFCTASLHSYMQGRFVQLAIFATLAILTKETAVVLPATFAIPMLLTILRNGVGKKNIMQLLCIVTPLLVWVVFLITQWLQNGWFFFPLHKNYISLSIHDILGRIGYYLSFILKGQGRFIWTAILLIASVVFLIINRGHVLSKMIAIGRYMLKGTWQPTQVLVIYIAVSLLVSALNFHLARYMMLIMPALCCLVAAQTIYLLQQRKMCSWLQPLLLAALFSVPLLHYKGNIFNVDADMSYAEFVTAQQEISAELNRHAGQEAVVGAEFPVYHGLIDVRAGYSAFSYKTVVNCGDNIADYLILSSFDKCRADAATMQLLRKITTSISSISLYKRINIAAQ